MKQHILLERIISTYFAVIADVTPDSSHIEQATFFLRYLNSKDDSSGVQERFPLYAVCSSKRGKILLN